MGSRLGLGNSKRPPNKIVLLFCKNLFVVSRLKEQHWVFCVQGKRQKYFTKNAIRQSAFRQSKDSMTMILEKG